MMKLRRPSERLGECMWLPRFIDKARLHFSGELAPDFEGAFCSPLGIDGAFFAHFGITKFEILDAIRREPSDEGVLAWFTSLASVNAETIRTWNEVAPNFGRPGFPGERTFKWVLKYVYPTCSDPRVTSAFLAIAWDEGFIEELCPTEPSKAG